MEHENNQSSKNVQNITNTTFSFVLHSIFLNGVKYKTQHLLKSDMSVNIKMYKEELGGFWCASRGLHV
jgi:hypothetical protein